MTYTEEQHKEIEPLHQVSQQLGRTLYWIFFIMGIGVMLPFNTILTPIEFYQHYFAPYFLMAASVCLNTCTLISTVIIMLIKKQLNQEDTIINSFAVFLICLVIIPYLCPVISNATVLSIIALIPVCACGFANGFLYPSILAISAEFGQKYIQAVTSGNQLAGLLPCILLIIAKLIVDSTTSQNSLTLFYEALSFYIIAALIMVASLFVWFKLKEIKQNMIINTNETGQQTQDKQNKIKWSEIRNVFIQLKLPCITLLINFVMTFSLFPEILALIPDNSAQQQDKSNAWWSIWLAFSYAISNYVVSVILIFEQVQIKSQLTTFIFCLSRLALCALFMLEIEPAYNCTADQCTQHPIIQLDWLSILTMIMFGLSNGYIFSVIVNRFQLNVDNKSSTNIYMASVFVTFMFLVGTFLGGLVSIAIYELCS